MVSAIIINQYCTIHTKLTYFGRQMIGQTASSLKKIRDKEINKNPSFCVMINPHSNAKYVWDFLMIVLTTYTVGYAPYRTAFMNPKTSNLLYAFETICDLLFFTDIFVSFLTPFERVDGSLEQNYKKVSRKYIFGALFFDMVATLPTQFFSTSLDYLQTNMSELELTNLKNKLSLLRILRVLKVFKLFKYSN